jgi:hypothetical protein
LLLREALLLKSVRTDVLVWDKTALLSNTTPMATDALPTERTTSLITTVMDGQA